MSSPSQIWGHRSLVVNLAQRDLKTKYKKSILGWLWSLINPAATLAIYTFVFGVILQGRAPEAGEGGLQSFPLFLFAGLVMWNGFASGLTDSMGALEGAAPLLTKIYFPPESPALAAIAGVALQTVTETAILFAIMIIVGNAGWTFLLFPIPLLFVTMLSLGFGLVLSILNTRFRDVGYLVAIVIQVGFYLTPIVYPVDLVPEERWGLPVRQLYQLNPMARLVEIFRDISYYLRVPALGDVLYVGVWAAVVFIGGWVWFSRASVQVIEEL